MKGLEVFAPFTEELHKVEAELLGIFQSASSLLPAIGFHILKSGGKRLRPLFLLLSSDLCGGRCENRFILAAIIEAIHTASLLHDDVIDGAETRRGKPSANSQWGNQTVILVGDYLYSNALRLAVQQRNQSIMEALSEATTQMTEGEILQLERTSNPEITIEDYYRIISAKTGVLIAAACKIGAILSGCSKDIQQRLHSFGLNTGIAFQVVDDVLDYSADQGRLGKKIGKDLEEGKITMPLILLLQRAQETEKLEISSIVRGSSRGKNRVKELRRITQLLTKYDCISGAMEIASRFVDEAKDTLKVFDDSIEKQRLISLAEYSLRRNR